MGAPAFAPAAHLRSQSSKYSHMPILAAKRGGGHTSPAHRALVGPRAGPSLELRVPRHQRVGRGRKSARARAAARRVAADVATAPGQRTFSARARTPTRRAPARRVLATQTLPQLDTLTFASSSTSGAARASHARRTGMQAALHSEPSCVNPLAHQPVRRSHPCRARTGNASNALVSPSTQRRMTAFMRSHCGTARHKAAGHTSGEHTLSGW